MLWGSVLCLQRVDLGEPLSSKLSPASGVGFKQVLIAEDETELLAMSNKGYGFKTQAKNLDTNAKAGKAFLSLSEGAAGDES